MKETIIARVTQKLKPLSVQFIAAYERYFLHFCELICKDASAFAQLSLILVEFFKVLLNGTTIASNANEIKRGRKGGWKMKTKMADKFSYIGGGIGLTLFVIFGLLPGSFMGGALGLSLVGALFGMPVEPTLSSGIIVGVFMLIGIFISGLLFISFCTLFGWLVGTAVDRIARPKKSENEVHDILQV